jgi:hypothetical protein
MIIDPRVEFVGTTLKSTDLERVIRRMDSIEIQVRGDGASAPILLSIVNLLARLFPNVTVEAPHVHVSVPIFGNGSLSHIARKLAVDLRSSAPPSATRKIVIDTGTKEPGADIYVTADAWTLALSRSPLEICSHTGLAQSAAAALAASEAFREALPEVPGVRLGSEPLFWNLLDYRNSPARESLSLSPVEAVCFGAGSVGSSILYSLLLGDSYGHLVFVDPDLLSSRNRFRYPLWLAHNRESKAHWIERMARGSRIKVEGFAEKAEDFIYAHPQPISTVVAAVDSVSARRDICDALARTTLNVGVDGLRFHVSRHHFGDGYACSYCQYVDVDKLLDEPGVYQELTGLDERRVRELLGGAKLLLDDLQLMIDKGKLPRETTFSELVGGRLQDALRIRLYQQAVIPVDSGTVAIAAPFVSALAGCILAAELQKLAAKREDLLLNRRVDIDCSGFPTGLQSRALEDLSGRCLCHSDFRRRKYNAMWNF